MAQDNSKTVTGRRRQLSLFDLLGVTCIVAVWFGVFLVVPNTAYFLIGVFVGVVGAFATRKSWTLIWLPLVAIINCLFLVTFFSWILPESPLLLVSILVCVFLTSMTIYTVSKTRQSFENDPNPKGILLKAIGFNAVAGYRAGLMIGIPIVMFTLVNIFRMRPGEFGTFLGLAVAIALGGFFLGYVVGVPLSPVSYFMVKKDFQNRQLRGE